ncbi:sigma-70 family RNA polymerase sigma factor [Gemmata sp. JC717]|uniref:sigma-70 family RNA polymerase sigma factor n=1 Tax=Gemmata algarum TaxID=2975278 RepID=UPI0021BAF9E2|nr:sigma-70 family RNA polymerase sigma factor [Gemmata algarum]MDY3554341.1 sigma-70 family RNA polymerase sigma factor [Gemmata algarum]
MSAPLSSLLGHVRGLDSARGASATDAELLSGFAAHCDEAAFTTLVQRHGPMVLRVCRRVLRHEQDAEDAFQATFLTLARRAAAVRKGEALASWLHGVACRTAASARRAAARRRAHEERARPAPVTAPGDEFAWREVQSALDEEVQRLPEKYRAVFVPCCLEGESRAEVARQLGEKEGTVSSRLAEARNLLRRRLARRGITLSALLTAVAVTQGTGRGGVPAALARSTVRAAGMLARGAGAGVSHRVLTLIGRGGVNRPGLVTGALVLTLLAAGLVVGAATTADQPPAGDSPVRSPVAALAPEEPVRTDRHGDPLPEGAVARIGTQRFRHGGGSINRLLPTSDGKMLVSKNYSGDASVCVWELATGRLIHQFPGHYDENRAVALSPDGKTLALGQDKAIRFYDLASGKEVRSWTSSVGDAYYLAFSPDGKVLASAHGGGAVLLWDVAKGRVRTRLTAGQNTRTMLVFSPDGKTLATADVLKKLIRLFDVTTGKERQQIGSETLAFPLDFAFSPDGATLAAGGDGTASLWDVTTGKPVRELHSPNKHLRLGLYTPVLLAWSPDGKSLATSDLGAKVAEMQVRLWDPATGKELRQMQIKGSSGMAESLAFTADGQSLICGDNRGIIRLWDPATGSEKSPAGLPGPVGYMAVSPDGKTLAFSTGGIALWDLAKGREIGMLPESHGSFAFAPDGKTLAGGSGNELNVWDVAGQRLLRRMQIDMQKEKLTDAWIHHIAFSPDGKAMTTVSGEGDGPVNRPMIRSVVRRWDTTMGRHSGQRIYPNDDSCSIQGIAFSPDGTRLVTSGRDANQGITVRVLDAISCQEQSRLQGALNRSLGKKAGERPESWRVRMQPTFSPDGRLLAMNRGEAAIPVWEMTTGNERCLLRGHDGPTSAVAFSADGRTLASAGWDHTIRVWDVETARELKCWKGHRGLVNALAFTPDGRTLISAGNDCTLLLWDVLELTRRPRPMVHLGPSERDALWSDLASADAGKAHAALARLASAPTVTVPAVRERVRPAPEPDARLLAQLVRDLDSEEFAAREKASQELGRLGESVEAALKSARKGASPEAARRCDELLTKLAVLSGDRLRGVRAVEVLERIGTPEAVTVLESLARGAPQARLTRDARAARDRLARPAGDR